MFSLRLPSANLVLIGLAFLCGCSAARSQGPVQIAQASKTVTAEPRSAQPAPPPTPTSTSSAAPAVPETTTPRPPDPPGEEMARTIAAQLRESGSETAGALPPPRDPNDNNLGSLVRSSTELAAELEPFTRSHDGKHLAFVRKDATSSSLWMADIDGTNARSLFDSRTAEVKTNDGTLGSLPGESLFDPQFSRDDRRVYFQTDSWATSFALYATELTTGKTAFQVDTNGYDVLDTCEKRPSLEGHLIAYRHSYSTLVATAVDLYFLLDSFGKEVGILGPEPENVARYLASHCSTSPAPPPPPAPSIPPQLRSLPPCGQEGVLRYEPILFLDGTILPIFYIVSAKKARVPFKRLDILQDVSAPLRLEDLLESFSEICGP
jgi:hypothetical protein